MKRKSDDELFSHEFCHGLAIGANQAAIDAGDDAIKRKVINGILVFLSRILLQIWPKMQYYRRNFYQEPQQK